MKLTIFFLTAFFVNVSAAGFSQTVTLSGKSLALPKIFNEIEKQTGFVVFVNFNIIKDAGPIAVHARQLPLVDFLRDILKEQPLEFTIENRTIILSRKKEVLPDDHAPGLLNSAFFFPIFGKIVDSSGQPLVGATVSVKNAKNSDITNAEGRFTLNVNEKDVIIISFVGYETREVLITADLLKNAATSASPLGITINRSAARLEEVSVVSTGYQTLPRERATGSFGIVTSKQLAQSPVVSVLERLQGLVPGLDINTKTTAGKSRSGTVTIRGLSTIKSTYTKVSTDPLLVIDGFPSQLSISNGAFDFLNPDDIEQVTVLKDAAAASIWGIQAANGVIVITTKKGTRSSRPSLNFSTTMGTSKKPTTNFGTFMTVPQYIDLERELVDKGLQADPTASTSTFLAANNSQGQAIIWRFKRGEITQAQMDQQLAELGRYDNSTQMAEYLLQPPATKQYNLSLSGGGLNSSYFMSGYFYTEDRVYRSNKNKGYSVNVGTNTGLANGRITVSTSLNMSNTRDKVNSAASRALSLTTEGGMRPYDMLKNPDGSTKYYDILLVPSMARNLESKGYLPFRYSPIDELNYSNTLTNGNNIALNVAVNGSITPWLGISLAGNAGRTFSEGETYWEPDSYEARMLVNKATSISTGTKINGVPVGGRLDLSNGLGRSYNLRGQINVNKNWQNKHLLSAVIGNEIRETFTKSSSELRYGYDKFINTFRTVNPTGSFKDINGNTQSIGATSRAVVEKTTRAMSYYANGAYTFNNKYTVSASTRFDDYNLLGVERRKRAIPLWSAGAKWNIKNERFMDAASWIDQLAARFTYGFTGNAPQGFAPVTVISLLGPDFYTGYANAIIGSPAIQNLAWEKTRMMNYGIDFSLFKNRVSGSLEYYQKLSTDILWQLPINGTYGFNSTLFNTAQLDGRGFDIGLNAVPVAHKNFKWTTFVNLSFNTNVIKDVRFKTPVGSLAPEYLYDGYPTDYLFSYSWAGLDKTGQSLINDPKVPGKTYTVLDNPFYDSREYSGRTTSPWFGGLGNAFQYKDLELSFQLQYVFGGVFRKPSITSFNTFAGRNGDLALRWRKPGDELTTNVPGYVYGTNTNYFASSNRYTESSYLIRSRSNVKLQQIMLTYNVPQHFVAKAGMKGIAVSAAARNLGMVWAANKEKMDPDYVHISGNNYQLSPTPNFSFRVGINF